MIKRETLLRLVAEINEELGELGTIITKPKMLIDKRGDELSEFDLRALGSLLHDFYTGAENIFQLISDTLDGGHVDSPEWHRKLVEQMALEIPDIRPPVISRNLRDKLIEYLKFRHVFRNVYGHMLEWKRIEPLVDDLESTYQELKSQLEKFIEYLIMLARSLDGKVE